MIEIAILRLPLTRELSSKARLRERKDRVFMRSYFSPSVFLLTQKSTSQLPFRSVLLSLCLEIATGNPHPRQREAREVIKFSPPQTPIFYRYFLFQAESKPFFIPKRGNALCFLEDARKIELVFNSYGKRHLRNRDGISA